MLAIFWFSFLLANFFLSNSVWKQELDKNELYKTVWAQELDKQLADTPFQDQLQQQLSETIQEKNYKKEKLELQEHNAQLAFNLACNQQLHNNNQNNPALTTELWENELGMNLAELAAWNIQLFNHHSDNIAIELAEPQLENNKEKNKTNNNLASQQLDRQHLSLQQPDAAIQLQQLCLQDPASATSRQLPKEPLSFTGLQKAAWPAATLTDNLSFSKQKLSAQDLPDNSFDNNQQKHTLEKENSGKELYYQFFEKNFGPRTSEKQLQQNLSQDQQLSFEQPSFKEKTLNSELATNLGNKKSFAEELFFQSFFFDNLAFQKNFLASRKLAEQNFYKKQLADSSFTQTGQGSLQRTASTTLLPSSKGEQAAFQQLGSAECRQRSFTQRTLPSLLSKSPWAAKTSTQRVSRSTA